jgi:hypothetical protein
MPIKAVQQFQLGTVLGNEKQARETLRLMKEAGYEGIELCSFMTKKIPFAVKMLTRMAGMPVGRGGRSRLESSCQGGKSPSGQHPQ